MTTCCLKEKNCIHILLLKSVNFDFIMGGVKFYLTHERYMTNQKTFLPLPSIVLIDRTTLNSKYSSNPNPDPKPYPDLKSKRNLKSKP